MYLIEEAAVKEYCRELGCRIPGVLWDWLEAEGPIIRAEAVAVMSNGRIRFRSSERFHNA